MASLWSGTNSSCVSVFVIYLPPKNTEDPEAERRPITGQLAKEIQLKHRAPVIGITLYDNVSRIMSKATGKFNIFCIPGGSSVRFPTAGTVIRSTQSIDRFRRAIQSVFFATVEARHKIQVDSS